VNAFSDREMTMSFLDRRPQWQIFAALALLFAVMLGIIQWPFTHGPLYEEGDFAANSLLILDAKHFGLWVGNYSRVGFNHPGPAILDLLAIGEVLFYDWLHFVGSPFAGQLLAVACMSAAWLAALGVLFTRLTGSVIGGLFALAAFSAVTAFYHDEVLLGAWFPDLYYLPFAVFTVATALLCAGRSDSLIIMAVSCGLLWNAHVAFIAITGLMLLCVPVSMAAHHLVFARPDTGPIPFVRRNRAKLIVCCAILALFMIPCGIETVIHFPGPLADYAKYSGQTHRHGGWAALRYVAQYWGGGGNAGLLAGLAAFIVMSYGIERWLPDLNGLVVACAAASIALVAYADFGIDDLTYAYIGLFYGAVPAIMLAACFTIMLQAMTRRFTARLQTASTACAALSLFAWAWLATTKPVAYAQEYGGRDAGIDAPALFAQIRALGPQMPAFRMIENSDYGMVWTKMASVLAYAKRQDLRLFCISSNWHILYTKAAKCTSADLAHAREYTVELGAGAAPDTSRIVITPFDPAALVPGNISKITPASARGLLANGWSVPDQDFTWSIAGDADLHVVLPQLTRQALAMDVRAFLAGTHDHQSVAISIAGHDVAHWEFDATHNRGIREIPIPSGLAGTIHILLKIALPAEVAGLVETPFRFL
jgi:hypothetical protein